MTHTTRSMGRRRIEIARIQDKPRRQTTFTKRRDGIFKKTGELCNMCGVDAAVIAFSEANNAFAFGNPSVVSVVDRYLDRSEGEARTSEAADGERVRALHEKYEEALAALEAEKKRGEALDQALAAIGATAPLDPSVEDFGLQVLDKFRVLATKMIQEKAPTEANTATHPVETAGPSTSDSETAAPSNSSSLGPGSALLETPSDTSIHDSALLERIRVLSMMQEKASTESNIASHYGDTAAPPTSGGSGPFSSETAAPPTLGSFGPFSGETAAPSTLGGSGCHFALPWFGLPPQP